MRVGKINLQPKTINLQMDGACPKETDGCLEIICRDMQARIDELEARSLRVAEQLETLTDAVGSITELVGQMNG